MCIRCLCQYYGAQVYCGEQREACYLMMSIDVAMSFSVPYSALHSAFLLGLRAQRKFYWRLYLCHGWSTFQAHTSVVWKEHSCSSCLLVGILLWRIPIYLLWFASVGFRWIMLSTMLRLQIHWCSVYSAGKVHDVQMTVADAERGIFHVFSEKFKDSVLEVSAQLCSLWSFSWTLLTEHPRTDSI